MRNESSKTGVCRRYDLDWLRVIAFGVLIYFHAAVAFLPQGIPMTLNAEPSVGLTIAVAFSHQFRLALLFFVSGCGVYFATRSKGRNAFIKERSRRLLVPLIFGVVVLVPIMVYLEKTYIGALELDYWHFYLEYFTEGVYPRGHLSWHHFWFLAYLYLFCLLAWPIFRRIREANGRQWINETLTRYRLNGFGIYLFILPLLLVEIPLRPIFPGFRDLIHDWASFSHWFMVFVAGFVFAFERGLLSDAEKLRTISLCAAVLVSSLLFWQFWQPSKMKLLPFAGEQVDALAYLWFCVLRISNAWLWILVCVGYSARYLNRPSVVLSALNRAVYPTFCLHLPVLVALESVVLPMNLSIAMKFFLITSITMCILYVLYQLLRRISFLHVFVGMRGDNSKA